MSTKTEWGSEKGPDRDTEKYQAGEAYADTDTSMTGLLEDLKAIGRENAHKDISTLLKVLTTAGKPIDDREMMMEHLIALTASLPSSSKAQLKLSQTIVKGLWGTGGVGLKHPPMSYVGDQFKYRQPDGSYNSFVTPQLGAAGSPYARTCPPMKKMQGVRPDPGLLFDLLQSREAGFFQENPAGLSSMLFYHATIIIHDIFRTNRQDANISDTSSYLDLAPLYGSSLNDQIAIRTMSKCLLKPDTFHEKRLLGQPPGVNVILVLYSRFHNYVADMLLKINESSRFSLDPFDDDDEKEKAVAIAKQDHDLFNTARLIVGGMYINISLGDYLRGLTNNHHSNTEWTLDPRIEINGESEVPRGVGNQVSLEFNLLYRFHPAISLRDEKWTEDFFSKTIVPDSKKNLEDLDPVDLFEGLIRFDAMIPKDPSKREFGGMKRGPDGKVNDSDLVAALKASMEDPAGLFGPRMVPKALRVVEILGTLQAREWACPTLNEFRAEFGLKRYETMEDINPNPGIADIIRKLYTHPDMVELYPGLFIEDGKPPLNPGCGGCPPYTVGRAVFSDAITLVRSDRFYTVDYTPATLTNWGIHEVQSDKKTLGCSMFYKLIQRGVPGWFPYNSLHVMQPMFTRKTNELIARELKTIDLYTLDDPSPPRTPVVVVKNSMATKVLKDQGSFKVIWAKALNSMFPGKDYSGFMLGGDLSANTAQRNLVGNAIYDSKATKGIKQALADFVANVGAKCLQDDTLNLSKDLNQIDLIRDVAIPVNARMMADLFCLDLKSPENPDGTLSTSKVYEHLLAVRTFGFNNSDVALSWNRRRWAADGTKVLTDSTNTTISQIAKGKHGFGIFDHLTRNMENDGSLRWYGRQIATTLLNAGKTSEEVSEINWLTAVAGVGVVVGMFADVLGFFMKIGNSKLWAQVQDFAATNTPESDRRIREFVIEAQRLTSTQRDVRVCVQTTTIDGQVFNKGDAAIILLGEAGKDPSAVDNPSEFRPGRPTTSYMSFGAGPHECLGREIAYSYLTGLIKLVAGLKNLRPAPGDMGLLKQITVGTERCYLSDNWGYLTFDPTTWKFHFDGYGKGVSTTPTTRTATQQELKLAFYKIRRTAAKQREAAAAPLSGTAVPTRSGGS